jgi:ABC-type transport system substrate-binding protein
MKKAKIILCMLLALVMMFSLFACGKTSQTGTSPNASSTAPSTSTSAAPSTAPSTAPVSEPAVTKPSTIKLGVSGWLGRFLDGGQPAQNIPACSVVYDQLFYIDAATKEPYSKILSDWKYTDDLTFVMTLKPGITFTNGDKATADDLLYAITNHSERGSVFASWLGSLDLANCTSDGKYSVTLKWTDPWGPGIYGTTLYLYDKAWCEKTGWDSQDWYSSPNGSGPYKCTEYVTDDHLTLELKDDYWNAANEKFDVQKWIMTYYPDPSTMYMALEKGDIAACAVSNNSDYQRWVTEQTKNVGMKVALSGDVYTFYVGPTCNPVFKDKAVREALAYGVDWAAIGDMMMGDLYTPATSILVDDSPYYKNVGAYSFDPDRAKQILADAGYKAGDIKIHDYEMSSPASKNLAEAFQFYCQELGIEVTIEFGDVTSALTQWMTPGGSDVGWFANIFGIPDREPHKSLGNFYIPGFTWQLSDDQKVIDMCTQALKTMDKTERIKQYQEIQQYVYDNVLIFPVYASTSVVGYRSDVFTQDAIDKYIYSSSNFDLHGLSLAAG